MNGTRKPERLSTDRLYTACPADDLGFDTTENLGEGKLLVGQDRAYDALQFGLQIDTGGYNLYALGPPGTGKKTVIREIISSIASKKPPAPDWCYVNNFEESHKPRVLRFPNGTGTRFKYDMGKLIEELQMVVPATFEGDEYRNRVEDLEEEFRDRQTEPLNKLNDEARSEGIALIKTPGGFAFAPLDKNGEIIPPDQFNALSDDEKAELQKKISKYQEKLKKILMQFPDLMKEAKEKYNTLNQEMARTSIGPLFEKLKNSYSDFLDILSYINTVEQQVLDNIEDFHSESVDSKAALFARMPKSEALNRYSVNLVVDNSNNDSAPVIFEDLPNHANLIGRSEYQSQMGVLVTDFTMIKPGALHRANGGFLVLNIQKVLIQPYAWEGLKRTLQSGEIRIESLERTLGLVSTLSLEPEPIPLDIKVILVGDRMLYYLLHQYDPDFPDLFKIAADFNDIMDRTTDNVALFAGMIGNLSRKEELLPLDKQAVARLVENSSRMAGDAEKLSTNIRSVKDLITEADFLSRQSGQDVINGEMIQKTIDKQIYRNDRVRERINEEIRRGTLLIDTEGDAIGQVNGLSVLDLGNFSFGKPTRITATVRLGSGEVIDIERETELGGAIHSKGVMIISSFLASRYSSSLPFSITASIVFEQSYGSVEGDSASVAELCALLSAVSGLPVCQSFAVTGSVNQHGIIQPIGGVNEKIEGFFDICNARGMSGSQGVIIPAINVKNLMLRNDVVEAADKGKFHIYAVEHINEALELLLDTPTGGRDDKGAFPEGSINYLVEKKLGEFAYIRRKFTHDAGDGNTKPS